MRSRWLRAAAHRGPLVAAALLVAALAVADTARRQDEVRRLVDTAHELGLSHPGLETDLRRGSDPALAALRLARTTLESALAGEAEDPAPTEERRLERLQAARRLGRSVLTERPVSWEAATIAGAATYLLWSETRNPRLIREHRAWEAPLEHALELAPERPQPGRYLATAYLELWPVLSEEKRGVARALVTDALADRATFARLIGPWLEIAGESGLEAVPDRSWAWDHVRRSYAERRRWQAYCAAWERGRSALGRELGQRLAEAEGLIAGGELIRGRSAAFGLTRAPTIRAFAPLVDRALRIAPHGPVGPAWRRPAREWLEWARLQARLGRRPLSPQSLLRLRSLAFPRGPEGEAERALWGWVERPGSVGPGGSPEDPRHAWSSLDWSYTDSGAVLWLVPETVADGLRVAMAEVPPSGAAVEVRWDGASRGCSSLDQGETTLEIPLPISRPEGPRSEAPLHRLEVRPLGGGDVLPGRTALLRRPPGPPPG